MTVNGGGLKSISRHPLRPLTADELLKARNVVVEKQGGEGVVFAFRSIYIEEPKRTDLIQVLIAEHGGPSTTVEPPRLVKLIYDVIKQDTFTLTETVVDVEASEIRNTKAFPRHCQTSYMTEEFSLFYDACVSSDMFKEALEEFIIPENFKITIDPWPYDRLATGGVGDGLEPGARSGKPKKLFENSKPAEYVPELLDRPLRTDLKPINVVQPEGTSFKVHSDNLVEWQNWRFRLGFTPREGAVLHDAFDFGDGGVGRAANNLKLGCDCLGAIHYFDSWITDKEGKPTLAKNVVCLHEEDNGIGWKHTNFRTDRAVVTRMRELVIQFIVTLANYEYVFVYKLDLAGGITVETRATGIVSVVSIDEGKKSEYGNIVSPGVLAQNHQHIFAVRIDPSIDSYAEGDTTVVLEESHPVPMNPETNPYGNGYEIRRNQIERVMYADAEPRYNRTVRMENVEKTNPISGKNVSYKFIPAATQLLLADENSTQAARAPYAKHHLWFTGHRDGEFWAAGEFTNQSKKEEGGVKAMLERGDWFIDGPDQPNGANGHVNGDYDSKKKGQKSTPVIWNVFGLTHNPRVEDWPVMPVEIHQFHIKPGDFFTSNPALDVPGKKNDASVLVSCCGKPDSDAGNRENADSSVQQNPATHLQGTGPDVRPEEIPK
ncbi:putative copper amine oxidase protein [Eutypa lata UCREL1]|uniref:Amine oxidase n=1 Tax=Eutypa lata (strain UCR-EL1) TaxID=1287681 RepID=M7SU88_EUTLA|nr:putative copper amine oxidase protein [Eutypa lata UCREL1]